MLKLKVNARWQFEADSKKGILNGEAFECDIRKIKDRVFHIIQNGKSYRAELLSIDPEEKKMSLRINGNPYSVQAKDRFDELLEKMGMNNGNGTGIKELRAPMPGLVLDVKIKEEQILEKGTLILVLEAMKMENTLKSIGAATVKKILVKKGDKVEKGQALVLFN